MSKIQETAVVLVSGGMDSLVCLAEAYNKYETIAVMHLNYGQRTSKKELECFNNIADHYQIPGNLRKIINMQFLSLIGGSSLTDESIEVSKYEGDDQKNIPSSYVPFRNSIILSLATSWAEVLAAKALYIGANYEDSPGYPDCRPEYYETFNELIKKGTKNQDIEIYTPIIMDKKKEIVQKAIDLNAPLELTWSCYARSDKACGVCDSCALRLRGFEQAKHKDPIEYKD